MPIEDTSKKHPASSKSKKSQGSRKISYNDYKFVEINLTRDQKEVLKDTEVDEVRLSEFIELMLDDGHKLSIKYEAKSGAYLATLSGVVEKCPNYGLILSSRAPTFMQSLLVLYFKCEVVMEGLPWFSESGEIDSWG